MTTWQITNTRSGIVFGEYEGDTPEAALEALAQDAGYSDYAEMCEVGNISDEFMAVRAIA
jgi:hypothetical protein